MRVVAGIVAMLLLAGCAVQTVDLDKMIAERNFDADGQKKLEAMRVNIGKTYWLKKKNARYVFADHSSIYGVNAKYLQSKTIKILDASNSIKENAVMYYVVGDLDEKGWIEAAVLQYESDHPIKERSIGGDLKVGMTKDDVIMSDYGQPDSVKKWWTENHETEVWHFQLPYKRIVYLRDGKVYMIEN